MSFLVFLFVVFVLVPIILLKPVFLWAVRAVTNRRWTIVILPNVLTVCAWAALFGVGAQYSFGLPSRIVLLGLGIQTVWVLIDLRRKRGDPVTRNYAAMRMASAAAFFFSFYASVWAMIASIRWLWIAVLILLIVGGWTWWRAMEPPADSDVPADG